MSKLSLIIAFCLLLLFLMAVPKIFFPSAEKPAPQALAPIIQDGSEVRNTSQGPLITFDIDKSKVPTGCNAVQLYDGYNTFKTEIRCAKDSPK